MGVYNTKKENRLLKSYEGIVRDVLRQALAEGKMPPKYGSHWSVKKKVFVSHAEALKEALEETKRLRQLATERAQKHPKKESTKW